MSKQLKMIEVVKKLVALSQNNPSQEEAIAAALKAQELMVKYSIEEKDLGTKITEENIEAVSFNFKGNINDCDNHSWKFHLAVIIAKNFRCETFVCGKHIIKFFGYKSDAELAKEVFVSLYKVGDKLGRKEKCIVKKTRGTTVGVYNSFVLGFLNGLKSALDAQCTALMVVVPKEVKEDYDKITENSKPLSSGVSTKGFNKDSYTKGVEEGKKAINSKYIG